MVKGIKKDVLKSETFKRKRKNIVRDWLYFIVWYVRLKRILKQHNMANTPSGLVDLINSKSRKRQG